MHRRWLHRRRIVCVSVGRVLPSEATYAPRSNVACNKRQSCLSVMEHTCGRLRYSRQDCLYYIKIIAWDLQDKGGKTYACSMGNGIIFYDNHSYTGDGWYLLAEHTIPVRLEMRDGKIHRTTTGQQIEKEQITGRIIAIGIPIPPPRHIFEKTRKIILTAKTISSMIYPWRIFYEKDCVDWPFGLDW